MRDGSWCWPKETNEAADADLDDYHCWEVQIVALEEEEEVTAWMDWIASKDWIAWMDVVGA